MHYAISFDSNCYPFLLCTPRKKTIKHQLIHVTSGLVLIKLGKIEYAVEPGQDFWLPFDTLTSITFTPQSKCEKVEISSRVIKSFPKQAGYLNSDELILGLLNRLTTIENSDIANDYLKLIMHELAIQQPHLIENQKTKDIKDWQEVNNKLSQELKYMLVIREAQKQIQSGKKRADIVAHFFHNDEALVDKLENAILGTKL
jgi:hypothetical protein